MPVVTPCVVCGRPISGAFPDVRIIILAALPSGQHENRVVCRSCGPEVDAGPATADARAHQLTVVAELLADWETLGRWPKQ